MKIAIASDLHLEFSLIELENTGVDLLILAGDICTVASALEGKFDSFFEQVDKNFPKTVYILGNHEHYGYDIEKSYSDIKEYLKSYPNITVAEDEVVEYNGYSLICSTLWTNYDNQNFYCMRQAQFMMNDFRVIKQGGQYLTPEYIVHLNKQSLKFIERGIKLDNPIVITHHSPSMLSCSDEYKDQGVINYAYHNELYDMIADSNIQLWVHGHTHTKKDYNIEQTRVICNPRGYDDGKNYKEPTSVNYKVEVVEL